MKPYYEDKWGVIYLGDCREILPQLDVKVDLVLTDPPYGINRMDSGHKITQRFSAIYGDDKSFDPEFLMGRANWYVLWGANNYSSRLPDARCWLMWQKHDHSLYGKRSTSPFELAWTNLDMACKAFRLIWDGSIKQGIGSGFRHCHPTEKPVELFEWCISLAPYSETILDPFLGSGTTAVCAKKLNRHYIGIEIEEKYCEIAAKRLSQEVFDFREG